MIDFARIKVIAGNGGNGAGSFEHVKGKRRGKADGGDGGVGGNVYILASVHLNTLEPFRFVKEYKANDGGAGSSKKRTGAEGVDLEVKVPVGTQIRVISQGEKSKPEDGRAPYALSFDLTEINQRLLIAQGGEGGRGNRHLRDEFGRRPLKGEIGEEGETRELELELKLIADVGLVGLPNAGKSTLISALTSARPKIAPYPFTTLEPNLGVMRVKVESQSGKSKKKQGSSSLLNNPDFDLRLVIADIPGLIEGASEGKGLGDLFLRHIERTKILVHIIDAINSDPLFAYDSIRSELKAYSKDLAKKKEIIVLNKTDLLSKKDLETRVLAFKVKRKRVICISAQEKNGLEELVKEILKKLR